MARPTPAPASGSRGARTADAATPDAATDALRRRRPSDRGDRRPHRPDARRRPGTTRPKRSPSRSRPHRRARGRASRRRRDAIVTLPPRVPRPGRHPPRRSRAGKPTKFIADLTKAMQRPPRPPRGDPGPAPAPRPRPPSRRSTAGSADEAAELRRARRRRRRRDPRVVEGRDRPHPRGDRDPDHRPQDRARGRDRGARRASSRRRVERVQGTRRGLRGGDGLVLRAPPRRGGSTRFAAMAEDCPSRRPRRGSRAAALIGDGRRAVETPEPMSRPRPSGRRLEVAEAPRRGRGRGRAQARPTPRPPRAAPEADAAAEAARTPRGRIAVAADDPRLAALGLSPDFEAAEAEAEMSQPSRRMPTRTRRDPDDRRGGVAARLAGLVAAERRRADHRALTTQVVVTGLVSVASIASFKRGLGPLRASRSVGVSSGPDGEFVFTVSHEPGVDLERGDRRPARASSPRDRRIRDGFDVVARDPEAATDPERSLEGIEM